MSAGEMAQGGAGLLEVPLLSGALVQGVRQPAPGEVVLETHSPGQGAALWLLSVDPVLGRLQRVFSRPRGLNPPPRFCQALRAHVVGMRVAALRQPHPQVLWLHLEGGGATRALVLELNNRESDLWLLEGGEELADGAYRVRERMRQPPPADGRAGAGVYTPPPRFFSPPAHPLHERLPPAGQEEDAARASATLWASRAAAQALESTRGEWLKSARRMEKRARRRLDKLREDERQTREAEKWKHLGELLQIHMGQARPGMATLRVPDVFAPDAPEVEIPLQPELTPGENVQRLFQRYRKLRGGAGHVAERLASTEAEVRGWETLRAALEQAGSLEALEAARDALPPALGRQLGTPGEQSRATGGQPAEREGPLERLSSQGYRILVGRSREENAEVTFRHGKGRDWWLHVQGIPGSHVLVVAPKGEALPQPTLMEAAWLAAWYSKARSQSNLEGKVEVDYTQRKHVRKIKGGQPGEVTYTHNKTVLVALEDPTLRKILGSTGE